jgi:hypothetical protein
MRASKTLSALAAVAGLVGWTTQAEAAPPGFALGIERGFSISHASQSTEVDNATSTDSATTLGRGLGLTVFDLTSTPRVGIDYIMDGGLTLGGGIGYASVSGSSETEVGGMSVESDGPTFSGLVFAPRVGYAMPLADSLDLWPRGGITYASLSAESTTTDPLTGNEETSESSSSDVFLTLEVPLLVYAAPNLGFLIAPTFDYSLSHTDEFDGEESDADVSLWALGLRFGVVGML